jgi:hypothetical protein
MIGSVTAPKITAMTDGWVQGNTQTDLRQPREHSLSSLFFKFLPDLADLLRQSATASLRRLKVLAACILMRRLQSTPRYQGLILAPGNS